jgi:hypothetical protein
MDIWAARVGTAVSTMDECIYIESQDACVEFLVGSFDALFDFRVHEVALDTIISCPCLQSCIDFGYDPERVGQ